MATKIVIIPPINPIRFVRAGKVLPAEFNYKQFDSYWLNESLLDFQENTYYKILVQYLDLLWTQIHHTGTHGADIFVVDCEGNTVAFHPSRFLKAAKTFPGNTFDNHGDFTTPIQLNTYTTRVSFADPLLQDDKTYFLKIEVYFNVEKTDKVIYWSEPIHYRTKHRNTLAVDYSHESNDNDKGVFWTNITVPVWNMTYRLRMPGYIEEFTPQTHDTFMEDQLTDLRLLSSFVFRKFKIFGGYTDGLSDYHIDKLNRAFSCSNTKVDDILFVKEDGAQIDIQRNGQRQIKRAELEIREYYGADAGVDIVSLDDGGIIVDPGETGGSGFLIVDLGTGPIELTGPVSLTTEGEWDAYVDQINELIAGEEGEEGDEYNTYPFGITGMVSYDPELGFIYTPGEDDQATPAFSFFLLSTDIQMPADVEQDHFITYYFVGGTHIVDWGDGNLEVINYTAAGGQYQEVTHQYGTTDVFDMRIYHDNTGMEKLKILNEDGILADFTGNFPQTLQVMHMENGNIPTLTMAILEDAAGSLTTLIFKNCGIQDVNATAFDLQTWTGGLVHIDLSENELTTSDVDDFLIALVSNTMLTGGGYINLSTQATPAPPSGDSNAVRATLTEISWTQIYDEETP